MPVLFIHRTLPDAEIYFVSNQHNEKVFFNGEFRVSQEFSPELWNPVTGEIRYLPDFKSKKAIYLYLLSWKEMKAPLLFFARLTK